MGQVNAYFCLEVRDGETFVRIHPPVGGGNLIAISEITNYLNDNGLNGYDLKELNRAINLPKESVIKLAEGAILPVNEKMTTKVSLDKMNVTCRFFPPTDGGSLITVQEILGDLKYMGIKVGIQQEAIISFMNDRNYCTDYVFAVGEAPIHGKDAKIEYFFNTNVDLRPKYNEDGTVDYHELGTISHIEKGDLLARLIPEDKGKPGHDVYGQEIRPRTVHGLKLEYANNISISEDRTEIYSNVTGHASLVNDKVFVSDEYEVPADVDNSVGNIDYPGSVLVRGNVKGGFSIYAKGDIVIEGVVEDAFLEAEGQIIVKRGIHGMTKGILKAGSNVICKFIENANVIAGGYVETDSILHSSVSAFSEIHVNGKNGFITGGVIRAGSIVEAKTIGSDMGATTTIEVGVDPQKKERYSYLKQMMQQRNKEISQIKPILETYAQKMTAGEKLGADKVKYVQQLAQAMRQSQQQLSDIAQEYEQLHSVIRRSHNARVKVSKTIYPGVIINISDTFFTLKEEHSYSQIVCEHGEIKVIPL